MIGVIVFPPLVVVLDASIVVVAGEPFFGDGLFFPPAPVINQNVTVIILYYDFFLILYIFKLANHVFSLPTKIYDHSVGYPPGAII